MAELTPLDPIPECIDEDPCTPLEEVEIGLNAVVSDPATHCVKRLENVENAVQFGDGVNVYWANGSAAAQIVLDQLQELGSGSPVIIVQNGGGSLGKMTAPDGTTPWHIVGKNGAWNVERYRNLPCFEDICECEPDELAGWQRTVEEDGSVKYCLVRRTIEDLITEIPVLYFASTSSVQVTGTGTAGDPYKFWVKVSGDTGNIIESRADGIFTECCLTYDDVLDMF